MLLRVVLKSLARRRLRVAVAALAVALGSLLVSSLAVLSLSVAQQARQELRAYGANLLLVPQSVSAPVGLGALGMGTVAEAAELPPATLEQLASSPPTDVIAYAPFVYGLARLGDGSQSADVVVSGTNLAQAQALSPWWQVAGAWPATLPPTGPRQALVGTDISQKLGVAIGQEIALSGPGGQSSWRVSGVLSTGGSEDSQIVMDLAPAQSLLGRQGVDLVQLRAQGRQPALEATARGLEAAIPGSQARVVRQVASAESSVVAKVQGLMALVAMLVLVAASLAVFSTMATTVLERTPEVGLMKALGASPNRIGLMFTLEATAIGAAGGLTGFALGLAVAQAIGKSVFGSYLPASLWALPATIAVALAVALLASLWPIRRAVRIEAARILRGE
ncbi:MAG: ABC transporter permease [Chloroflexi bacterium]|nr:ABC transporter permease [Chloroflexota bacterium]